MRCRRVHVGSAIALIAVLVPTGAVAFVCHPDPLGTRTLALRSSVGGYAFGGSRVLIRARSANGCRSIWWSPRTGAVAAAHRECAVRAATGGTGVKLSEVGPESDRVSAVAVLDAKGNVARRWPLPEDATTVDAAEGIAVASATGRGVYALNLRNGDTAYVGPNRPGDRPQIGRSGVVFEDNLYKHRAGDGRVLMKFVPRRALREELARAGRPLTTPHPISAFSMDGPRVAVATNEPARSCDRVYLWNPLWRSFHQLSEEHGPTCDLHAAGHGSITQIAKAGSQTAWVATYGGVSTVIQAQSSECQEWVVGRLYQRGIVSSLAGDGQNLVYAVDMRNREQRGFGSVAQIVRGRRAATLVGGRGAPELVSVDSHRIASLLDGTVEIRTSSGAELASVPVGAVTAITLRRGLLGTISADGRLDIYDAGTSHGRLLHSWPLPRDVDPELDIHVGIAVVTAGNRVYALDITTGRTVLLARAPAPVRAQIEAPGIVYSYNSSGKGHLRLIRLAQVLAPMRKH